MRGDVLVFSSSQQWGNLWALGSRVAMPHVFPISFCSRSPVSVFWFPWRVVAARWLFWSSAPRGSLPWASLSSSSARLSRPYGLNSMIGTDKSCESIDSRLCPLATALLKRHSSIISNQSLIKALLYRTSNSLILKITRSRQGLPAWRLPTIEGRERGVFLLIGWEDGDFFDRK